MKPIAALLSASLLLLPAAASAQTTPVAPAGGAPGATARADGDISEEVDEADDEDGGGFDLPVSISGSVGLGTSLGAISRNRYTTTDSLRSTYNLSVSYPIWNAISASLGGGYTKCLTESGCLGEPSAQYEGRFGDLSLDISDGSIFSEPVTGIGLSGGLSFTIPVSPESRHSRLYTAIGSNLGLSWAAGPVSISYGFGASKNFYAYTSQPADAETSGVLYRPGGAEDLSGTLVAMDSGVLPEWGLSNDLSVSVGWLPGVRSTVGFSFSDSWTYDNGTITEEDEFTSEFARVGRGHAQTMTGTVSTSYSFLGHFSASLSMRTSQAPKTDDNQDIRFPFFDLESGNLRYTSLALSLAANY